MGFSSLKLGQIVFCLLAALVVPSPPALAQTAPVQVVQQVGELQLNNPIERNLAGGQTDVFRINCAAGDFLHAVVDQRSIDVAVTIADPTGKPLTSSDSPNGDTGPEPASVICMESGTYQLQVITAPGESPGKYEARLVDLRPARPQDQIELQAEADLNAFSPLAQGDRESRTKAIGLAQKAAGEWQQLHNDYEQALALEGSGQIMAQLGQTKDALPQLETALDLYKRSGYRRMQAVTFGDIAFCYGLLGQFQKAIENYQASLTLDRELNDRGATGQALHNLGFEYYQLGDTQKALDYLNQALVLRREVKDEAGEVSTLNGLGAIQHNLNHPEKAIEIYQQSLTLSRKIGDRNDEGVALVDMANAYRDLNENQKALDFYSQAVPILEGLGARREESNALSNIGGTYVAMRQPARGLPYELHALKLARAIGDIEVEATVEDHLSFLFKTEDKPELAILFGTDAVNSYQQIRRNIAGMDKSVQTAFSKSRSSTYRMLAELLVGTGRLAEAEHVLDLLKGEELNEVVRGSDKSASSTEDLPRSDADKAAEADLFAEESAAADLTAASFEFDQLNALTAPTDADKAKLKDLSEKIAAGNAAMDTFFNKTLYAELGGDSKANARVDAVSTETSSLMNMLADLGPGTLALYTLVGDSHSYVIVTTANTRTRYELHTNAADLGKLVLSLRQELRTPSSDPSKDLETLSHILLDPIAVDLAAAAKQALDHIPTLLWSLDGVLRYVPMNALFDGKQYLVERARNVVITPESRNHLLDPAATSGLKAVAFGVSQSYNGLPALKGVTAELDSIVHDPTVAASHGPLDGKLLDNDAFTLTALESSLKQRFPIVHIASHFAFQAGTAGESYLLLAGQETGGKGYELTMTQFQTDPQLSFRGTRLLTLSACSTAQADTTANGREIDSLGMVMQKRDAAAVLATLWDVNDASTSLLMSDFYRRWAAHPEAGKGEALREAQLSMLHGQAAGQSQATNRGVTVESVPAAKSFSNYSHPYYWAPFTLIGNFR